MRRVVLVIIAVLEGVRVGQCADAVAHILVEVAGDFAHGCLVHRGFKAQAEQSFLLACSKDMTLVDVAGAGEVRATWADTDIARRNSIR
jgi:hypothetical protein